MEVSMKPYVVIILQAIVTLGLGVNGILSIIIISVPGGDELVADLFNTPNAPEIQILVTTLICIFLSVGLTAANIQSLKWKEDIE